MPDASQPRPADDAGAPHDAAAGPTVAELGEDALLSQVFPLLPAGAATLLGPGDDGAVLASPDGRVVVSTDVLVEGRHFRRDWSTGEDVGWRAAVQNLADVAAMGAAPTGLVVGLVVPPDLPVAWVLGLARGLAAACGPDVGVVGGDLSGGRDVVVAVTVHGDLGGREPVRRDGARPGDVVAHAGVRGRSAAGLALLGAGLAGPGPAGPGLAGANGPAVDDAGVAGSELVDLVTAYRRPVSPLAAGPAAARAGATAMLDVSDGLLRDAGRVARASGVVVDLDPPLEAFPEDAAALAPAARLLGADPAAWLLAGGEDHGLLATFPPGVPLPAPFRACGRVLAVEEAGAAGAPGVTVGGVAPAGPTGWDHFGG